jgi:hypothetical protein
MPDHEQFTDPMREVDLLLLEDIMMRRTLEPTKSEVALKTICMLLILLGVGVIFAHTLKHPDVGTVSLQPTDLSEVASFSVPVP